MCLLYECLNIALYDFSVNYNGFDYIIIRKWLIKMIIRIISYGY